MAGKIPTFVINLEKRVDRLRVVMLSGQDYPIKSTGQIRHSLLQHTSQIFIECNQIPWSNWQDGGLGRFPNYEHFSSKIDFHAGSQWMSIPYHIIQVIFDFLELNPLYIKYFQTVFIPDECFFQTLFMNCGMEDVVKEIIPSNHHLILWGTNQNHPYTLVYDHLTLILTSEKLFGRKFDMDLSSELLDYIDGYILN